MTPRVSHTGEVRYRPSPARFVADTFNAYEILDRMEREDAIAIPTLTNEYRAWLLEEAYAARFRGARPVVGCGARTVRQRMRVHNSFGSDSRFHDLTGAYQAAWDAQIAPMTPYPFESRLAFNDQMLQVYDPGTIGITPHMDHTAYRNLICLFVLKGRGRFGVCTDRSGRDARIIAHQPGDAVLMRAPGFRHSTHRSLHFVDCITEQRYVFGLRHKRGGEG